MNVTLTWSGASEVAITRNGDPVTITSVSPYSESLGKGSGTFIYQVCDVANPGTCVTETVVF